jgi:hypothetical protein
VLEEAAMGDAVHGRRLNRAHIRTPGFGVPLVLKAIILSGNMRDDLFRRTAFESPEP